MTILFVWWQTKWSFNFVSKGEEMVSICGLDLGMGSIKFTSMEKKIEFIAQVSVFSRQKLSRMVGLSSSKPYTHIKMPSGDEFFVGRDAHTVGRPVENYGMERFSGWTGLLALIYGVFTEYIQRYGEFASPL